MWSCLTGQLPVRRDPSFGGGSNLLGRIRKFEGDVNEKPFTNKFGVFDICVLWM